MATRPRSISRRRINHARWRRLAVELLEPRTLMSGLGNNPGTSDERPDPNGGDGDVDAPNLGSPPDTMGAVGPGQIVEMLNTGYTVYDKTTRQPLGPTISLDNFWDPALASGTPSGISPPTA